MFITVTCSAIEIPCVGVACAIASCVIFQELAESVQEIIIQFSSGAQSTGPLRTLHKNDKHLGEIIITHTASIKH